MMAAADARSVSYHKCVLVFLPNWPAAFGLLLVVADVASSGYYEVVQCSAKWQRREWGLGRWTALIARTDNELMLLRLLSVVATSVAAQIDTLLYWSKLWTDSVGGWPSISNGPAEK